jgi:zinc/manganese transport system ATP-binding protein
MITFQSVTFSYTNRKQPVFNNSTLTSKIKAGGCIAIVGTNGAGKTTFLKLIAGLLKPEKGSAKINHGLKSAYLPQLQHYDRIYPLTVFDVVNMGHPIPKLLWKKHTDEQISLTLKTLDTVNLVHKKNDHIASLSGGEFQRMLFARTLVENADIILLDEPFISIDEVTLETLLGLMSTITQDLNKTILCICHDLDLAQKHFTHVIHIKDQQPVLYTQNDWQLFFRQNGGRHVL